jgi:uncharacterized protein (TIGR03437 family)
VASIAAQSGIYFTDTAPDRMLLGNAFYELALSKSNGGILTLLDKAAGSAVTLGSRGGCLWGSLYRYPGPTPDYVGGCSYTPAGPSQFHYSWNVAANALTLKYTHDPFAVRGIDATVTVTASTGAFFDLTLNLQNHWDASLGAALFPSDVLFSTDSVQAGYLPFQLPGVRLRASWFQSGRTFQSNYPGKTNFADYLALDVAGGHLAYYSINPTGPIQPVHSGFTHYTGDAANQYAFYHAYQTSTPVGGSYTSPTVRCWVGTVPKDTILAYRADNGIGGYPSISTKLGNGFVQLAQSPLVKLDLVENKKTFQALIPQLAGLPPTLLIHPAAYMPGGHDHSYPDFLPPDPLWGTTADFGAFVAAAHSRGQLVMPYINPTWWKPESPTLMNLPPPLTTAGLAVRNQNGQPASETYGTETGTPVSPWHPFVQQRLDQVMAQWRTDVPVDFVFSDQVGSRSWELDLNPSEPTPLSYSEGWLNWWQTDKGQGGMTEDGWDRLAAAGIGFCGSPLTTAKGFNIAVQRYGIGGNGNTDLGPGNWDPYPLATWLMHDKVLFYQHDLEEIATTDADEVITWDLAFGYGLHYLWQRLGTARANLGNALQSAIGPYSAGHTLDTFTYLTPDVTASVFGALTVTANWQQTTAYTIDGYSILPGGYLARTSDGAILAGSFTGMFNGQAISSGEHHIIVQRAGRTIMVRQPVGADTDVAIALPSDWSPTDAIAVTAIGGAGGTSLGTTAFTTAGSNITFHFAASASSAVVDHYAITNATPPAPAIGSVVNGADFKTEPFSPGAWLTLFGQNFGSAAQWTSSDTRTLGGAAVSVCGLQAAISYNSGPLSVNGLVVWQLNVLMPDGVAGQTSCPVAVTVGGQTSPVVKVNVAPGVMELFGFTSAAGPLPIVTHSDYSLVGPASAGLTAARPGETLIAWGTGDCTAPAIAVGRTSPGVTFSGRVAPGLCQINFTVPDGLTGANPLTMSTSTVSYTLWITP